MQQKGYQFAEEQMKQSAVDRKSREAEQWIQLEALAGAVLVQLWVKSKRTWKWCRVSSTLNGCFIQVWFD